MLSLLPLIALASGLDADGPGLPAPDSEGSTGLVELSPRGEAGTGSMTLQGGALLGALVRTPPVGPPEVAIGTATLVRAQASVRWLPWLGATGQLPVRLSGSSDLAAGGPSLGDARATLWATTGQTHQLSLGVGAGLPTGAADRFAGAGRIVPTARIGGRTITRFLPGGLELMGHASFAHEGPVDAAQAIGGPFVGSALRAGSVEGPVGAGVSVRGGLLLDPEIRDRRGSPLEVGLDGSWKPSEALHVHVLGTRALRAASWARPRPSPS